MLELIDIYGNYLNTDELYGTENSWFGRILKQADSKYEGIVEDYNQQNIFLVFGELTKDSVTLIKLEKEVMPVKYEGIKEKRRYEGVVSLIDGEQEEILAECFISTQPAEKTREITELEINFLQAQIEILKKDMTPKEQRVYQKHMDQQVKGNQKKKK